MSPEKTLYPSDLLDSLRQCQQSVEDATIAVPVLDREDESFESWLDSIVEVFVVELWDSFFGKWVQCLVSVFNHQNFRRLLIDTKKIYDHAQRKLEFKLAEEANISVWVLPEATLEARFGGTVLTFRLEEGNFQERMTKLSEALKRNSEICLAMNVQPDKMIQYLEKINQPEDHMSGCFPTVIEKFWDVLSDFKLFLADKLAIVDSLQGASERQVAARLRFTLLEKIGTVKLIWERDLLYLIQGDSADQKARTFRIGDSESLRDLIEELVPYMEAIYHDVPTSSAALRAKLQELNPRESIQGQIDQSRQIKSFMDEQKTPVSLGEQAEPQAS